MNINEKLFITLRFLSFYLFPLKMDQRAAREKVMRYYKDEPTTHDTTNLDKQQDWNESELLLENILADLQQENNSYFK